MHLSYAETLGTEAHEMTSSSQSRLGEKIPLSLGTRHRWIAAEKNQ